MVNSEMGQLRTGSHRLKHRVLELEELQLQSLLDIAIPASFLTTVRSPAGEQEIEANWVTEVHRINPRPP